MQPNRREMWMVRIHDDMLLAEDLMRIASRAKIAREQPWTWIKLEPDGDVPSPSSQAAKEVDCSQLASTLPGERWRVIGEQLVRPGKRVPERSIPQVKWQNIEDLIRIELPQFQVAASVKNVERIPLTLIRGGEICTCEGLLTKPLSMLRWIEYVSESRLRTLRWVVADEKAERCVVLGQCLPPVDGIPLIVSDQLILPAGFHWQPRVPTRDVRELFQLTPTQWLFWESDKSYSIIEDDSFATVTRASVRQIIASQ